MRSFLARLTGISRSRVSIKPECDYIFLSGHGDEARGQFLRGKVTLFAAKGENVKSVQLRMIGRIMLGDHTPCLDGPIKWEYRDFFKHQWDPFVVHKQAAATTADGCTYEWPFELFIHGNQEVSARGCGLCNITYTLEASSVDEASSRAFRNFAPVRILRFPPASAYDLMDPVTSQGKWSDEIEYVVSLGHRAIVLGGFVPVEAQLAPLLPGVKVINARFYLCETHKTHDEFRPDVTTYEGQRIVSEWQLNLEDSGQPPQTWNQCLPLPKSVRMCSPDFNVCGITISHTLHFAIRLLDSSGIETERELSMPIALFVSPELPINGWGAFVEKEKGTAEVIGMLSEGIHIPPKYEKDSDGIYGYGSPPGSPPPAYSEFA